MSDAPLEVTISGDAADAFRQHFQIDSAAQARDALASADSLFHAGGHPWNDNTRDIFDWAAKTVDERFATGRYKEGELAAAKPPPEGQGGSARHAANDSNEWKAVCTSPDYCKVGSSVVPFDSYADIGRQTKSSPDVKAQAVPVYRVGDLHHGVQADAGRHIVSGTSLGDGYVQFLTGQDNVKVNGLPLVRHGSLCRVNCDASGAGGAPGQVVTVEKAAAPPYAQVQGEAAPNPQLQALIDTAADNRSLWQKTGDFFSGAWDGTKRIAGASWDSPGDTGIGVLKGIGNLPSDLWNLGVLGTKYSSPLGLPSQAMMAGQLEGAALAAYQAGNVAQANALASRASEMMSSGYVGDIFTLTNDAQKGGSFLSMVVPVGAAAKGLGTAANVVRGTKAADAGADIVRSADAAGDLAKGTEGADAASDAGKAGEAGTTENVAEPGVHVASFSRAEKYAELVNSNKRWSWREDYPGGENLTRAEKEAIRREAVERGLIPDVQFKPGTKFPDFEKAGLINKIDNLPESLWKSGDQAQFNWLDSRIPGGRPQGFTWHHSEIPGRMELVPFGPHNIITHNGGRSPGMWAHGNR